MKLGLKKKKKKPLSAAGFLPHLVDTQQQLQDFLRQNQRKSLPQGCWLHWLDHPPVQEFFSGSPQIKQQEKVATSWIYVQEQEKTRNHNGSIEMFERDDISPAQGLTSRLQRKEHHVQVVLQGQSTRHDSFALLKRECWSYF